MKLSREEFYKILYDASWDGANEQAFDARFAFKDGTLEIEGYERVQWTKFDPDDPKTFPPCNYGWFLIAAQKSIEPPTFTMMTELATEGLLEEIRNDIVRFKLNVYWRPLPKPPAEQEETK
jgi:hypothetical protein